MLGDLGNRIDFIGNVESSQLLDGAVDVVLCDGFTGNVLLKMLEGVAETAARLLQEALHRNLVWRLGIMMLSGGLRTLREATDYAEYGGSPLLGSSAVFIKAHGRSKARALKNAIRTAARVADAALPGRLGEALAAVQEMHPQSWLRFRPSPVPTV
jgi:glycerol-3-phosphate acyltransferase PlsX